MRLNRARSSRMDQSLSGPFSFARRISLGTALSLITLGLLVSACASLLSYKEKAKSVASAHGFKPAQLSDPKIMGFTRVVQGSSVLVVYIEGDGAPWPEPSVPPADPTPHKQLVLNLAAKETGGSVAYLGRPCQYLSREALSSCETNMWTNARFNADLVKAMSLAVGELKRSAGAGSVKLVGYSGGGAMAALVAAQRDDVFCLVTIAAPLDTTGWTRSIGVSPLRNSLNPADFAQKLARTSQAHFLGQRDEVVPPTSGRRFLDQMQSGSASVYLEADFDHGCCWEDAWEKLRRKTCLNPAYSQGSGSGYSTGQN